MGKRYRYEDDSVAPQEDIDRGKLSAIIFVGTLILLLGLAVYFW